MPGSEKTAVPAPPSGPQRSKRLRTITCVLGIGTAGVGLLYVLAGSARAIDMVLIAGGLLVTLASLVFLRGRNPGT